MITKFSSFYLQKIPRRKFPWRIGKCPSLVREAIKEAKKRQDIKSDLTNRIINKNLTIISYVSLANCKTWSN